MHEPSRRLPLPSVKVMVAGVDKDTRAAVETSVRKVLAEESVSGAWSVSIVSLAGKWSVTLDVPEAGVHGLSIVAERNELVQSIRAAVGGRKQPQQQPQPPLAASIPTPTPLSMAAVSLPAEARDSHACEHCGKAIVVVYERRGDEPKEIAPLACPHCWRVGHVPVGAWAVAGSDYRAEKA